MKVLRWAGKIALLLLGALFLLIDYLKHGGSISALPPQTEAWDKVTAFLYAIEVFLGYFIDRMPGHLSGIIGLVLIAGSIYWMIRARSHSRQNSNPDSLATQPPSHPAT